MWIQLGYFHCSEAVMDGSTSFRLSSGSRKRGCFQAGVMVQRRLLVGGVKVESSF
ncbi:hypothetical protein RchiOBHm_Chr6g0295761 [Rosa chinensis]|uniref:Uncharacterized protein n=1 Tax=Rosa chinensis TaxID=74649 RepID=A0A2P6PX96_ROSCH|nr:hypothetical protein RchiOBHm_Chr6g0295761 [Rosa chinensis]